MHSSPGGKCSRSGDALGANDLHDPFRNLNVNSNVPSSSLSHLGLFGGFDFLHEINFTGCDFPPLSPLSMMLREITVGTNLEIGERLFSSNVLLNYVSKFT